MHGIADFGFHALNALRMEKGYRGSAELTSEIGPVEADMLRFVRLDKDYIGRDAVTARQAEGPASLLAYLEVDVEDADCLGGEPIVNNGHVIGLTSSGGYGYVTESSLAFGFVRPELARPGTDLSVEILGERRPARVLAEAAYDPSNERLRG